MNSAFVFYNQILKKARSNKEYWTFNGKDVLFFPMEVPQGITTIQLLEDMYNKYRKLLASIDDFKGEALDKEIQFICKSVTGALKQFLSGDIITAYDTFSKLMVKYIDVFPVKEVEKDILFYRMRTDFDMKNKEQFYHLPLSLRSKCASERYSIAGYPCLYIGYSKNDCYLEISPNGSMIGLSLKEDYDLQVLDMTFFKDQMEKRKCDDFIKIWPIIAACNLVLPKPDTEKAKFREEYVIPQMLTAYLKHNKMYDGICYYSVRNETLNPEGIGEDDYRNLVLFPNLDSGNEYDNSLLDKFEWYIPFNVGFRPNE